jgi:hypothetical protein
MITCKTFVVANNILVDMNSKKISAINLVEDSIVKTFPFLLPIMVYTAFEDVSAKAGDTPNLKLNVDVNGELKAEFILNIQFDNSKIAKNIANVGTIPIEKSSVIALVITTEKGDVLISRTYTYM